MQLFNLLIGELVPAILHEDQVIMVLVIERVFCGCGPVPLCEESVGFVSVGSQLFARPQNCCHTSYTFQDKDKDKDEEGVSEKRMTHCTGCLIKANTLQKPYNLNAFDQTQKLLLK